MSYFVFCVCCVCVCVCVCADCSSIHHPEEEVFVWLAGCLERLQAGLGWLGWYDPWLFRVFWKNCFFFSRIFNTTRVFNSPSQALGCYQFSQLEWLCTLRSLTTPSFSTSWVAMNWEKNTFILLEHPVWCTYFILRPVCLLHIYDILWMPIICLPVCQSICLSVCLSICLSVCLFVCLSVWSL